jgi:anti-sigma factor ChrR (cupin superfamily)
MSTEQQQEKASLYVLGALPPDEREAFENELRADPELQELTRSLQRVAGLVAASTPSAALPPALKNKVLARIESAEKATARTGSPPEAAAVLAGLQFIAADDRTGWKQLPVPGAWIKLLSLERDRGYAVLLGKLEPGVRYPAHVNAGPEDFYILTGDLHVAGRALRAGDFHHAAAGSQHGENYSVEGCTLLAVLTTDDPLVAFAMGT